MVFKPIRSEGISAVLEEKEDVEDEAEGDDAGAEKADVRGGALKGAKGGEAPVSIGVPEAVATATGVDVIEPL